MARKKGKDDVIADGSVKIMGRESWTLMPPAPDRCQTCAAKHKEGDAHDPTSLYYQMAFERQHGRLPCWRDAVAHCEEALKAKWIEVLTEEGYDLDAPGGRQKVGS